MRVLYSKRSVFTFVTILSALLASLPGATWAGAMSPRIETATIDRPVHIPLYTKNLTNLLSVTDDTASNAMGMFSTDPNQIAGLLLNSAQRASNRDAPGGVNASHAKLDNTGFVYYGRSFGAGSLVGLASIPSTSSVLDYYYEEIGFASSTSCERNTALDIGIVYNGTILNPSGDAVTVGYTAGTYPNGEDVSSMWIIGTIESNLFAADEYYVADPRHARVFFSTLAPSSEELGSRNYNNIQCTVTFTSHMIGVTVNTTARTMTTDKLAEVPWPSYADAAVSRAMLALRAVTVTSNGVGGSQVERALQLNTETLYYSLHGKFPPNDEVDETLVMQSVPDFVTNLFENMLVMIGASMAEVYHSVQPVPAQVRVPSVVFGRAEFHYITFTLTILVIATCVWYILIRRAWNRTVQLDFSDIANVVLNASKGGTQLFDHYCDSDGRNDNLSITVLDRSARYPGLVYTEQAELLDYNIPMSRKGVSRSTSASTSLLTRT